MKSSLRGISAIALIAAAFTAGCGKPPTESFCAKGNECGLLDGKTEAQCVTDGNKALSTLHNDAGCNNIAEKYEAVLECGSTLSCAELKDQNSENSKCKQQAADLVAALLLDAKTCQATVPGVGGGATTSTGSTEPSDTGSTGDASTASGAGSTSGAGGAGGGK